MRNVLTTWSSRLNQPVGSDSRLWRYGLAFIVAVFILTTFIQSLFIPIFEGDDEQRHYAYARFLVDQHTLPPRGRKDMVRFYTYAVEQESGQPPLYYAVIALITSFVPNADNATPYVVLNPFYSPGDYAGLPYDNHVLYLHGAEGRFPFQGVALAVHLGRLASIVLGALTLLAVFALGRAIVPARPGIALLAVALIAAVPGFIYIHSVITNDTAIILFVTLSLWVSATAIRKGPTPMLAVLGGLFGGLAVLSKLNGAWVIGIVWLALVASTFIHRRDHALRTLIQVLFISGVMWLAVTGWWFAYGMSQNGDPFGLVVHAGFNRSPLTLSAEPDTPYAILASWGSTTWYAVNWSLINGPDWLFATYTALYLVGIAGLPVAGLLRLFMLRNRSGVDRIVVLQGVCLILPVGLALAGGAYWQLAFGFRYGRLLYPGLTSAACLAAIGWACLLAMARKLRLPQALYWAYAFCLAVLLMNGVLWSTTNNLLSLVPVQLMKPLPQDITRTQLTYLDPADGKTPVAEVIGYRVAPQDLHASSPMYADICWKSTGFSRLSFPYAMQLVGPNDIRPGSRTSFHGLGRYPMSAWRPGEEFCDPTSLYIAFSEDRPRAYKLVVTLYDAEPPDYIPGPPLATLDGNGQPTYPVIGRVRVAPDPSNAPVVTPTIRLGDFAGLAGTQIELQADHTLSVTVRWVALNSTSINAHVYLHVLDSSGTQLVAQDDHEPDGGWFPTNYWQKNDVVDDHFQFKVPAGIDRDQLNLRLGLYNVLDQVRLPAVVIATNERLRDDEVTVKP